jgi:hypothetical protein
LFHATVKTMGRRNPHTVGYRRRPDHENGEPKPLFSLGQLIGTLKAIEALGEAGQDPAGLLLRHMTGDQGDLCEEDGAENHLSVEQECEILSAYKLETGVKVWVITKPDRSATAILLPSEYQSIYRRL